MGGAPPELRAAVSLCTGILSPMSQLTPRSLWASSQPPWNQAPGSFLRFSGPLCRRGRAVVVEVTPGWFHAPPTQHWTDSMIRHLGKNDLAARMVLVSLPSMAFSEQNT